MTRADQRSTARWAVMWATGPGLAVAMLAAACSDDGFTGQTGQAPAGTGDGTTGTLVTSADGDDGIDPSVPTATAPGSDDGTTAALDSTAGSEGDPTKPTDDGEADSGESSGGPGSDSGPSTAEGGSSESGAPSDDDGLTFGTGGTLETLEFANTDGLPTFGATGTPATNCMSIDVPASGYDVVVAVELEVAFAHTWIGDVTIELVAPDDTTLTVLNRAGHPAAGNFGDDSDAVAASPLTFADDSAANAEQMGSMLGAALAVCAADAICDYFAAPDAAGTGAGVGVSFADFAGLAADGQWMVCFTDHADEDPLTVSSATLRITKSM